MNKEPSVPKRSGVKKRRPAGRQTKKHARTDHELIDDDFGVRIFKTKDSPNWYAQYNDPAKGQRKKSLRTHNKKEACRKARILVRELESGDLHSAPRLGPKIEEAVERFVANKRRKGRRESTVTEYRRALLQFCHFCQVHGVVMLGHVTPSLVSQYEDALRLGGVAIPRKRKTKGRPVKPNAASSIHEKIKLVKSLAKFTVAWKLMQENPISGYDLPQDGKPDVHCYSDEEVRAICKNAKPFFPDVFSFFAHTGLRQSELRWATKNDVDLERRHLLIRSKEFRDEGVKWDPKGDDRAVPLCEPAFEIAKKMIETTEGRWLFPAPWIPGGIDDQLRSCRLHTQLKAAKRAAGVQRGVLHSFRHFFVSTMANANASPFKVMKIVGHKSLDIILTYYHVDGAELLSAIDEVDFGVKVRDEEERI